jgi:hypothetical protein
MRNINPDQPALSLYPFQTYALVVSFAKLPFSIFLFILLFSCDLSTRCGSLTPEFFGNAQRQQAAAAVGNELVTTRNSGHMLEDGFQVTWNTI